MKEDIRGIIGSEFKFDDDNRLLDHLRPNQITCNYHEFFLANEALKIVLKEINTREVSEIMQLFRNNISELKFLKGIETENLVNIARGILEAAHKLDCPPDLNTVINEGSEIDDFNSSIRAIALEVKSVMNEYEKDILDLSYSILESENLEAALTMLLEATIEMTEMDSGGIYVADDDGGLVLARQMGFTSERFKDSVKKYDRDSKNVQFLLDQKTPIFRCHSDFDTETQKEIIDEEGLRVIGVFPIFCEGELIASFQIASHEFDEVSETDKKIMGFFANRIGGALHRKITQEKLHKGDQLFEGVINASKDAIVVVKGKNAEMALVNPSAMEMFGFDDVDQAIGRSILTLIPKKFRKLHLAYIKAYLDTGEQNKAIGETLRVRAIRQNGEKFHIELSISGAEYGNERILVCVIRDITKMVEMEEKLRQSQKMEAVGTLAAGVGHDFNNLLTIIMGYMGELSSSSNESLGTVNDALTTAKKSILKCETHLMDSLMADTAFQKYYSSIFELIDAANGLIKMIENLICSFSKIKGHYKKIDNALESGSRITAELMAFASKQVLEPKILNFNKLIKNLMGMCTQLIGKNIEISQNLDMNLKLVKVDPGQMERMLLNFVINARDAINSRDSTSANSVISISTRNMSLGNEQFIEFLIEDNGVGMDKEVMDKIFDPFFTTKPKGDGSGLGLSVVHGIIRQSGGKICVESEIGVGTKFRVMLPVVEGSDLPKSRSLDKLEGDEVVLVVDDDNMIREFMRRTAIRKGYEVLTAENGRDALDIFIDNEGKIDLVFTDLTMPIMKGEELAQRLREIDENVHIVFMSGGVKDVSFEGPVYHLAKPFRPNQFLSKIREICDED
ncbi:ATP-binding protein [Patescibacteria group bacterium]